MQRWAAIILIVLLSVIGLRSSAQDFKENKGQWPDQVRYLSQLEAASIYLEDDGLLIDLKDPKKRGHISHDHHEGTSTPALFHHHAYRMRFVGETTSSSARGKVEHNGRHNYFLGNDQSKWASDVRSFSSVAYQNIYKGIDGHFYYSANGEFKYDLIVSPGAQTEDIRIEYEGVTPKLLTNGDLLIPTVTGEVREARPYAYQEIEGVKKEVSCAFVYEKQQLRFALGEYDRALPLVIDPILVFSTYSGSFSQNFGYTATFDRLGFLYSGSTTFGPDYPITIGAYDESFNGGQVDIAISKYDSTGTLLIYSTFIGGSGTEVPHSIIVNDEDELYLFGTSGSADYPVTNDAYMSEFIGGFGINISGVGAGYASGCDMIISRLSADGDELLSSTFVGGNGNDGLNLAAETRYNYADELRGEIELDSEGKVYVASCTTIQSGTNSFPTTAGAIQTAAGGGLQDGVIFRMSSDLSEMEWSTFFGGSENDAALSVAIKENGDVVVSGGTASPGLPTTANVIDANFNGGDADAFILVLDESASSIVACSYWGTSTFDQAYMVELDGQDNIHLFGQTFSGDEMIINAGYSNANSGQFITKLSPDLQSIIWSTAFGNGGGEPNISPTAFAVDYCNRIYLSGWGGTTGPGELSTTGMDFTADAYQSTTDGSDFYLLSISDDASSLEYATFFGGDVSAEHVDGGTSRFDKKGNVYQSVCAGCGGNSDFPIQPSNVVSATNNNTNCNNAVFKMDFEIPAIVADFFAETVCLPDTTRFENTSLGGLTYQWDFGDNETSVESDPIHMYADVGTYEVTLIISDPTACNLADTVTYTVSVASAQPLILDTVSTCVGEAVQIGFTPLPDNDVTYSWDNPDLLDNSIASNPIATVQETTTFSLMTDFGICISTTNQIVEVVPIDLEVDVDTLICDGDQVTISASSIGTSSTYLWSDSPDFSTTLGTDTFISVMPAISTTYFVQTGDQCLEEDSVDVLVASEQILFSQNQFICADEQVQLSVSNLYPSVDFNIDWSPDTDIQSGDGTPPPPP